MEMYCGKCNKEVKDDMAFCPYCGAQIEKETDIEIKETYTRQEAFELLGNTLIFSQPEASRAWVHQGFMYLFNEVQQKILDIGDLVVKGTCEDYPQRIMEICLEYGERLLWQLLLLFGKERFASVINKEVQDAMINTIQKPLYEPCEKLVETYMEIISEPEQMRVYRELRKANRMQWSGGGFGIKGAIVGAVEAGAMNVASGMAHTAINSIGNAYSKKKYQKKLDELKQKYLNKYQDIFIDNCKKVTCVAESFYEIFAVQLEVSVQVYPIEVMNEVREKVEELQNEIIHIYGVGKWEEVTCLYLEQNEKFLKQINFENYAKQLSSIIKEYPYDWAIYEFIYKIYGDKNGEADKVAQYFCVDIDYVKGKIIDEYSKLVAYDVEERLKHALVDLQCIADYIHYRDENIEHLILEKIKEVEIQNNTIVKYVIQNSEMVESEEKIVFDTREQKETAVKIYNELKEAYSFIDKKDIESIKEFGRKLNAYIESNPFMEKALADVKENYDRKARVVKDLDLNESGKIIKDGYVCLENIDDVPIVQEILRRVFEEYNERMHFTRNSEERREYLAELQV